MEYDQPQVPTIQRHDVLVRESTAPLTRGLGPLSLLSSMSKSLSCGVSSRRSTAFERVKTASVTLTVSITSASLRTAAVSVKVALVRAVASEKGGRFLTRELVFDLVDSFILC